MLSIRKLVRGLRRTSRPFFVLVALAPSLMLLPATGVAQDPVRPWLDWRTLRTADDRFRFHYLAELEPWTRDVAARVHAMDSAITRLVGWPVPKPVDVVVDDPFVLSNGYALPFLDRPVTVLYATPADPRNDIGNYRTWGELLAVHELTHLAHLGRPSRNRFTRALWASLPVNVSPLTLKTPRWAIEGYATVVEGRISGTGRPNNAWRPAILRQWAIEGRLPTYAQLASWADFEGGAFAYLGGSAYLEWLMAREGDSSLVHVWRRLTARQNRSFDAAFRGVFGDAPGVLYGFHAAQLTRDAMNAKDTLEAARLVEGELVQRLTWATGDPAISPDGQRIAITLRERERPGRLVVWKSSPEPVDTAALRRRLEALAKDPLDVPDRRFYPRAKTPEKTLYASNGRSFQTPRWFADNRRVLATRWTLRDDGTQSPALYVWDTGTGDVRRVTDPVGVLQGDPHPNGQEAIAMQCHWGHCDIAHVDLTRPGGAMRTLLEGTPERTYYRPRYSPDGSRFVASVVDQGRWKIVVAGADGSGAEVIDVADGANRYDAQWSSADTLVLVSERGGIPNLEKLSLASRQPVTLTRVTGAAMAPDVDRRDGSIWFLSLHSRGLDVRRLPHDTAIADSVIAIDASRFGFAGARGAAPVELASRTVPEGRDYPTFGASRHARWLPGAFTSGDGSGGFLALYSGDVIGRLNALVTGALGEPGTPMGAALLVTWRHPRPHLELGAFGLVHEPSQGRRGDLVADGVSGSLSQGLVALSRGHTGDSWGMWLRVGAGSGRLSPENAGAQARSVGFSELSLRAQQVSGARGLVERLDLHGSYGQTRGEYQRMRATLAISTVGRDVMPLQVSGTVGRVLGDVHPFEQFTIGGARTPVMDTSLLAQRHSMPAFPTAIAAGPSLIAWRAAIPGAWTLFYEGASTAVDLYSHRKWHRAVGFDTHMVFPNTPVAFIPRFEARGGAAYTLDAPYRKKVRLFLEMRFEP